MTLYTLINNIKTIAKAQPNIGFVHNGDVYELNKQQAINYPAFVVTQDTHTKNVIDDEYEEYGLTLFAIDRLTSDGKNELDIQSWADQLLKTVIYLIEENNLGLVNSDYTIQPFTEKFESLCAGCFANVKIQINVTDCLQDNIFTDLITKIDNIEKKLDTKQDTLVSGTNIKTINGEDILGSGNLVITGGIPDAPIDDKQYVRKNGYWEENEFSQHFFYSSLYLDEDDDKVKGYVDSAIGEAHYAITNGKTIVINCSNNNNHPIVTNACLNGSTASFSFVHLNKSYIVEIDAIDNITTKCTPMMVEYIVTAKDSDFRECNQNALDAISKLRSDAPKSNVFIEMENSNLTPFCIHAWGSQFEAHYELTDTKYAWVTCSPDGQTMTYTAKELATTSYVIDTEERLYIDINKKQDKYEWKTVCEDYTLTKGQKVFEFTKCEDGSSIDADECICMVKCGKQESSGTHNGYFAISNTFGKKCSFGAIVFENTNPTGRYNLIKAKKYGNMYMFEETDNIDYAIAVKNSTMSGLGNYKLSTNFNKISAEPNYVIEGDTTINIYIRNKII